MLCIQSIHWHSCFHKTSVVTHFLSQGIFREKAVRHQLFHREQSLKQCVEATCQFTVLHCYFSVVSQARPNHTESDPRWGWLGLACETNFSAHARYAISLPMQYGIYCIRKLYCTTIILLQERMMTSFFIAEGGGRVCNCQKFETGRISHVY